MALTAQPAGPPNWGRWPQLVNGDYAMMESPAMLQYDHRTAPSHPLHRPILHAHYMIPDQFSVTTPQYQTPSPYQFGGYQGPPTPPHHSPPLKAEYHERRLTDPEIDNGRPISYSQERKHYPYGEQVPSPARSDSQVSTARSVGSNPSTCSKTITTNETINPDDQVNFETEVDELMKAIQMREEKHIEACQQPLTPGMSPVSEAAVDHATPAPSDILSARKRYVCNGPNCHKSFTQKTHLDIHRRTHTGAKPYVCDFAGCKLTFSQLGNLKTHVRRHTGERPYSCDKCGRRFAQRGNVRAHEQTHQGLKPFICKLDECNKTFSQLGNMKTHQNNFHKATLKSLTTRFAEVLASGEEVSEADRELFEYFSHHYKNSNKGIKGRGKARTVAERKVKAASRSPPTTAAAVQYPLPQIPAPHQAHHHHHQQQHHGLTHPGSLAAYSMSRGHHSVTNNMPREPRAGGYDMFEMDEDHHSVHPHTSGSMLYEEDSTREMTFTERMY
ncbi:hypothetical protein B0J13DRAFT_259722 [Dactylonectria estremocensis]|uniref:C2H2-type domain-containing protein n=1 Tax=Dactylonectria estremocensis TaxID=1079267 RepID=A0A9P9JAC6_9HYPO|nr:hypothetical protein B0J13DRAFT_259722 [Dactylonectria estremocensis]